MEEPAAGNFAICFTKIETIISAEKYIKIHTYLWISMFSCIESVIFA